MAPHTKEAKAAQTASPSARQERVQPTGATSGLGGTGRIPRTDPEPERAEIARAAIKRAQVRVQAGKLMLTCAAVEGATTYEWQVRRGEGHAIAVQRTSKAPETAVTGYPMGPPGVPQARVRALNENALGEWSAWAPASHDMGEMDG